MKYKIGDIIKERVHQMLPFHGDDDMIVNTALITLEWSVIEVISDTHVVCKNKNGETKAFQIGW